MWRGMAIALIVLAAIPAAAASTEDVLREFNLFGTWAVDCGKPPSGANPYVKVTNPSPGLAFEEHRLAEDGPVNRYSILGAERLSDTRVALEVIFQPGTESEERERLVLQVRDGTRRTVFNQAADGPVLVKDGAVVGHGMKTPLLRKCE